MYWIFYALIIFSICVQQFFNQVLMLGKTSVSDLSEHVFDLILELYNIDSHLLLSVLPQLEFKLKVLKICLHSAAINRYQFQCLTFLTRFYYTILPLMAVDAVVFRLTFKTNGYSHCCLCVLLKFMFRWLESHFSLSPGFFFVMSL